MLYWMSFVDDSKPKGTKNLGACVVEANDPKEAVVVSHELGCNPGGEVALAPIPEEYRSQYKDFTNKLHPADVWAQILNEPIVNMKNEVVAG